MRQSIKHGRPKAFAGLATALISAAASLASAGIGAVNAKKARRQQADIENYNNALVASENLSQNVEQGLDNQIELERQTNVVAKCGGRRKLKYGGSSTGVKQQVKLSPNIVADADGNFIEVQPGVFYSPNGPSHERGGINVDKLSKGGKKAVLEMEGNEIIDVSDPRQVTVITDRLKDPRTGASYLQEVLAGEDARTVGNRQELDKSMRSKLSCGGRKKALWGWNEEITKSGVTGGDVYSAGASALANIGSGLINYFTYKNMKAPAAPTLVGRNSLLTRYNIAPRLANLENARYNTNDYINRNSVSSASARESIAKTNLNSALAADQLYGEKTNKEVEMINANTRWLDEGRRYNAGLMSDYRNRLVDFRNQRSAGMASAATTTLAGLASNVNQVAENVEQREINKNNAYLTAATAQPEVLKYLYELDPYRFRRVFGMGRTTGFREPVQQETPYGYKIGTGNNNLV